MLKGGVRLSACASVWLTATPVVTAAAKAVAAAKFFTVFFMMFTP